MDTALLGLADEGTYWPWRRWPEFARWSQPDRTLVVVPLVGLADWGLGHPWDLEEVILSSVIREAARRRGELPLLVIPPVRFVVGPDPACAFAIDPEVATTLIEEIAGSIQAAGFERIVLLNSSPWNEALCDAVARDLRIERGLQMFCVNLSALDLDLHPTRSRSRPAIQALYTAITGRTPEQGSGAGLGREPRETDTRASTIASAAQRLVGLFREMTERPALAGGGRIGAAPIP